MKALQPLSLPLQGRQVIEASAGTGKTWTLAALYLRLVLGHGRDEALLPPQILVMTFTEAATAELRDRIRQRLSEAALYFDLSAQQREVPAALKVDGFLRDLRDSLDPSLWPSSAMQLHRAAEWMDDAAIYTIHAWSRRMLTQHALESHNLFEQTRLEEADALKLSLVQDYWREWFYPMPANSLQHLTPLIGQEPAAFLKNLSVLWREQERTPNPPMPADVTPSQAMQAHSVWQDNIDRTAQAARDAWSPDVLQAIVAAREQKLISGVGITAKNFESWLQALQAWAEHGADIKPDVLSRFGTQALQDKKWQAADQYPFFARVQEHVQASTTPIDTLTLIAKHAAYTVGLAYRTAKQQRAAFDFSDLLQNLHHAVMADDQRLATAIRLQYPVALVDEFQDTDPWQYGTLHRIYAQEACTPHNALVMIGDPKQAIYSFRGADLGTYLNARADAIALDANACHTLTGNHRSCAALVKAINHVFMQSPAPFASARGEIAFVEVSAQGTEAPFTLAGQHMAPLQVWHLPSDADSEVVTVNHYLQHAAAVFADQMATLLNTPEAKVNPSDMAVLVRHQTQADAIRRALRERRIPSVYLSDHTSVYSSQEGVDLWRLLRAVASPRQTAWVRAAVGSRLWGLALPDVQAMTQHEAQWEQLLDQFHHWHTVWQQQGLLPMLHVCLHSHHIAQRLLQDSDGERRLSNVLHLGELLQHAAQSLQGEHALVRFLGEQIQRPPQGSESQQTRLETDAMCVKVITYHKSKGLQYPLVFVPFAGTFSVEKKAKASFADEEAEDTDISTSSVEEDIRLLYVALTRAQKAVWLGVAETRNDLSGSADKNTLKRSALSQLLNRKVRGDLFTQLQNLWGTSDAIEVRQMPAISHTHYAAQATIEHMRTALTPVRQHASDWWTASFSALTRGLASDSLRDEAFADALHDAVQDTTDDTLQGIARDKQTPAIETQHSPWQSFPAGARYGTLLHDLLEWQSRNQWPAAHNASPSTEEEWAALLARKARWLQLEEAHTQQLTPWVQQLITTPLPLQSLGADLVLSHLASDQLWAEMEFSFEAHHVSSHTLDQLIQEHVLVGQARPALQARLLNGMLTGFMDLVLQHDGKYWVLDYKSNRLPHYNQAHLNQAILEKRYEVQYVLYTLALHRLLKSRLPNYDYEQHMGGCIYLFLRGIQDECAGVHAWRPSFALIEALDLAFTHTEVT